jgi:hypothetical protein
MTTGHIKHSLCKPKRSDKAFRAAQLVIVVTVAGKKSRFSLFISCSIKDMYPQAGGSLFYCSHTGDSLRVDTLAVIKWLTNGSCQLCSWAFITGVLVVVIVVGV